MSIKFNKLLDRYSIASANVLKGNGSSDNAKKQFFKASKKIITYVGSLEKQLKALNCKLMWYNIQENCTGCDTCSELNLINKLTNKK